MFSLKFEQATAASVQKAIAKIPQNLYSLLIILIKFRVNLELPLKKPVRIAHKWLPVVKTLFFDTLELDDHFITVTLKLRLL